MMNNEPSILPFPNLPQYTQLQAMLCDAKPGFADIMNESLTLAERRNRAWHRTLQHCQGNLLSLEVKQRNAKRYAAILDDPSEIGRFRALYFDGRGFSGHITRNSTLEVLEELVNDDYTEIANGTMAEISLTSEWALGTIMTNLIAEVNGGRISYCEMQELIAQAEADNTRKVL